MCILYNIVCIALTQLMCSRADLCVGACVHVCHGWLNQNSADQA